jgi:hypothetical protein
VAVHEECYGVKASENMGSWVCRACETPDQERECCLCPVKGDCYCFHYTGPLNLLLVDSFSLRSTLKALAINVLSLSRSLHMEFFSHTHF